MFISIFQSATCHICYDTLRMRLIFEHHLFIITSFYAWSFRFSLFLFVVVYFRFLSVPIQFLLEFVLFDFDLEMFSSRF